MWRPANGFPYPNCSGSRPKHQLLSDEEQRVPRSRSWFSSRSAASRHGIVSLEPIVGHTVLDRGRRRETRGKRLARRRLGTGDRESQEEQFDCKDRKSGKDSGDSGIQRDPLKGGDANPGPREEPHTHHRTRSRSRSPAGKCDGSSARRSPYKEHRARTRRDQRLLRGRAKKIPRDGRRTARSQHRRPKRTRSTSIRSLDSSSSSSTTGSEEKPRRRQRARRSSRRRKGRAPNRRRQ